MKNKRIILAVPALLLVAVITYHFGLKAFTLYAINKHVSREKEPNAYIIPVPRSVHPADFNNKETVEISTDYIKLKVPWKIKQQVDNKDYNSIVFYDKKLVTIYNRLKEETIIDDFFKGTPEEIKGLKNLIGEEHIHSDFDFIRLILNTTPDQATLFTPTRVLGRISTVLILRAMYTPLGDTIFEFQMGSGLKGFQFRKASEKKLVRIFLFNEERLLFEIHFMLATQGEIDYVLSSIEVLKV